ncbi:IS66 family transposase [Aestuariibacter salexigens]|uniref:IS66 family transposase n=1 Tax=Aestuariibacter salexigens TaxID=226010 RepID=UPI00041AD0A2|nr:IS66 family transposase [Aestuariibacter salexigens]
MQDTIQNLPDDPAILKQLLADVMARNSYLEEQFRLAQQRQFGASSEGHPGQGELFDEAEDVDAIESVEQESISYTRNKPARKPLPRDLPRETVIHDIPETDRVCDCCGSELHQMGEARSEKLEFIPAQVKVVEHIRPKYSCRHCEQQGTEVKIKIAPLPPGPIPKGIATPSLLSQIITSKYQYGLPLYRQESLFKQYSIELSRKTMADWVLQCGRILEPLYQRLKQHLLQQAVIQADETTVNVIKEDKTQCYMWVYCTGTDSPTTSPIPNIVLYDYQPGRSGQCAVDFLKGYDGYLQVDGYQGYEQTGAVLAGCWAHARRKFKEAEAAQGSTARGKNKTGKANWALNHIQKLYRIETRLKDATPEQRYQTRQEQSRPLLEQFKTWLDKSALQVPPKTAMGKAIHYCLRQWHKLMRYIEDGRLTIDNNRAERAIKPFVIGRKNWLFSNTGKGATASAMLYSIIETAKANGLTPFDYIVMLLEQTAQPDTNTDQLLPWCVAKD